MPVEHVYHSFNYSSDYTIQYKMAFIKVCLLVAAVVAAQASYIPISVYTHGHNTISGLGHAEQLGLSHGTHGIAAIEGHGSAGEHHVDHYAYPKYAYKYGVSDSHTGDHKSQHETRNGDHVVGQYTLAQPDGVLRVVNYVADHSGFHADVKKIGESHHPSVSHGIHHGAIEIHGHGHGHY